MYSGAATRLLSEGVWLASSLQHPHGGSVSEIDVATGTETSTHSVGIAPAGVAFTPDGRTAYVTDTADGYVSVVDVASGTVTDTIYGVGRFLQEIAIR